MNKWETFIYAINPPFRNKFKIVLFKIGVSIILLGIIANVFNIVLILMK